MRPRKMALYSISHMIHILGAFFAGILGLAFGSFLNVCATRWPEGESIMLPRSHCRHCNRTLAWWENVPLLSWLALRGRCRTCRGSIGWRYPLVELAVAATWAICTWQALGEVFAAESTALSVYDAVGFAVARMILCWLLICMAVLDAEHLWLPDWLTLGGAALGLLVSLSRFAVEWIWTSLPLHWAAEVGWVSRRAHLYDTALLWLAGMLALPALILLIRWTYRKLRGHEGIGLGDAKLVLLLAAWLGLSRTLLAYVLGVTLGGLIALTILLRPAARVATMPRSRIKLPLGTFLCVGGVVAALWGGEIVTLYLTWCGF